MSEVVSVVPVDAVGPTQQPQATRSRLAQFAPTAMVASVLGWVLVPDGRSQRGFSSVEYIFGIILVVALISVFITVVKDDSTIDLIKGVMAWALKLNKLLGWG